VQLACGLHAVGRTEEATGLLPSANHVARAALRQVHECGPRTLAESATSMLQTVARAPARAVRLNVLGPLELSFDGVVAWPEQLNRKAARDLLFLLVEHRVLTRGRAAALLWPDLPNDDARNNLRVALSYLNRALEPERAASDPPLFVEQQGERLQLAERDWLSLDVTSFDARLSTARQHERAGVASLALDDYCAAVALYRGDYLADAGDLEWTVVSRDRRRADFVHASVRAAELLVAKGSPDEAIAVASGAVAAEPWSEAARRVLAEAHLATGDRAAARRVLAGCYDMLRDLGVIAEPATQMLARRVGMS
jgi:DNA-binding SARP family transcriptional activator